MTTDVKIIDGKAFAEGLRGKVGALAASFEQAAGRKAGLAVVLVGETTCCAFCPWACELPFVSCFPSSLPGTATVTPVMVSFVFPDEFVDDDEDDTAGGG